MESSGFSESLSSPEPEASAPGGRSTGAAVSVWLFTNTCYGNWLPGDPRGSVTSVRDRRPEDEPGDSRIVHNLFGEPVEPTMPGLYQAAQSQLKGPAIHLSGEQAEMVLAQFHETCRFRGWRLRTGQTIS